jgi:hypothetical protein
MWILGLAKFQLSDEAAAAAWMRRSLEANRNQPIGHFLLGAVLAHLGLLEEARGAVQEGLTFDPGFTIHRFKVGESGNDPTYLASRARLTEGLRMAGVPET